MGSLPRPTMWRRALCGGTAAFVGGLTTRVHCSSVSTTTTTTTTTTLHTMSDESKGTAIVTGGSRGIGAAICRQLAADGFTVVVNYNSRRDLAEAVVKAIQANGGTAHAVQGDVSSEAGVMSMFERVDRLRLPPLTALVNNAGIIVRGHDIQEVGTEESYRKQMDCNVLGPLVCCREASKRMST